MPTIKIKYKNQELEIHPETANTCSIGEGDTILSKAFYESVMAIDRMYTQNMNMAAKKSFQPPKLFIGMESTNIQFFESPCCHVGLSIEPLSRVCCGGCGQSVSEKDAIYCGPMPPHPAISERSHNK